jgi:hypothetical protein
MIRKFLLITSFLIQNYIFLVQRSTASMGKFDRKIKNEKELNPIKKKNVDPSMFLSRKQERDRNNRILNGIIGKK